MGSSTFNKVLAKRKEAAWQRRKLEALAKEARMRHDARAEFNVQFARKFARNVRVVLSNRYYLNLATTEVPMDLRLHAQKKSLEPGPAWLLPLPTWVKGVYRYWEGINARACIKILPFDIVIDNIVPYLTVEDLISFRSVDKQFYMLLHSVTIWRRIFQNMHGIRLPILRPTFDPLKSEQAYELEQLIRRSITLEREWRLGVSRVRHTNEYQGIYNIMDIYVVPGGKFFVASGGDKEGFRYYVMLFGLDVVGGVRLLARVPTPSAPLQLCALYGIHQGTPGLYISWTLSWPIGRFSIQERLELVNSIPGCQVGQLTTVYNLQCAHFDLETAEESMHPSHNCDQMPHKNPKLSNKAPFRSVYTFNNHIDVLHPSLFMWGQQVYFGYSTFVNGYNAFVFFNVREGPKYSMTCTLADSPAFAHTPHMIRAWIFCRWTSQLFVVRSVSTQPGVNDQILFEFYDIANLEHRSSHTLTCNEPWSCPDSYQVDKFTISDIERVDNQLPYAHASRRFQDGSPPSLYVFASINSQKQSGQYPLHQYMGSLYWIFRPTMTEIPGQPSQFHYRKATLPGDTLETHVHLNNSHDERVLPGVHRTIVVEVREGIKEAVPVFKIKRFDFPDHRRAQLLSKEAADASMAQTVANPLPVERIDAERDLCDGKVIETIKQRGGVTVIRWDEGSGKIVMAHPNSASITVMDLGDCCEPLERLAYVWVADSTQPEEDPDMHVYGLRESASRQDVIATVNIKPPPALRPDLSID